MNSPLVFGVIEDARRSISIFHWPSTKSSSTDFGFASATVIACTTFGHAGERWMISSPADATVWMASTIDCMVGGVGLGVLVGTVQVEDEGHQRLGDEAAAEQPEEALLVRPGAERVELRSFRFLLLGRHLN